MKSRHHKSTVTEPVGDYGFNFINMQEVSEQEQLYRKSILDGNYDIEIFFGVNLLSNKCHEASKAAGWYNDPTTGEPLVRNRAEMICLMHSELSEAMEGERKGLMDDHLPNRRMAEVELADAVIRICDYSDYCGYDLAGAILDKLKYNAQRADHKLENRSKDGGKKF